MKIKSFLITAIILVAAGVGNAQSKVTVRFAHGSHSSSIKGAITGYKYVDYVLGAQSGQTMTVALTSNNDKAQMVVLDPNKDNVDYGDGVADYNGTLEKSGNYTVRILMSRADARRRGAKTSFTATFTIQ